MCAFKLPKFYYEKPKTIKGAIDLLHEKIKNPKILAGGTDLIVQMKDGLCNYGLLIDIKYIPNHSKIFVDQEGNLSIGAAITMSDLVGWINDVNERKMWYLGVAHAANCIGSQQIRNRATVVGNVCRSSPSGDMIPVLIALDAKVEIVGQKNKKYILVEEFITGPGKNKLSEGEIVTNIKIPQPTKHTFVGYVKYSNKKGMGLAITSAAVRISLDKANEKIKKARIVLGAVASTAVRIIEGERILVDEGIKDNVIEKISNISSCLSKPITDIRATEDYRQDVVKIVTSRAIKEVWKMSKEGRIF